MEYGNTSHIKFGGYDPEGSLSGKLDSMWFLKTKGLDTWAIDLVSSTVGNISLNIGKDKLVLFELAYPYVYIPQSDFILFANAMN
jgi:hypothetical protein